MCCLAAVSGQETQNRRPFLPLYPHFVSTLPHIHTFCATFWAKQCRMVPSPSIKNQKAPRREFPRGAKPRVCCALGATSGGAALSGCSSTCLRAALSGCSAAVSVLRALLLAERPFVGAEHRLFPVRWDMAGAKCSPAAKAWHIVFPEIVRRDAVFPGFLSVSGHLTGICQHKKPRADGTARGFYSGVFLRLRVRDCAMHQAFA